MSSNHVLNMKAAFGFSHDLPGAVHSLFDESRESILFPASHTLVYHDCRTGIQQFLQGHANEISAVAVTNDKKWAVSGDYGEDPIMIIWDCKQLLPIRTYSGCFGPGILRVDFSDDGALIAVLTGKDQREKQRIQIYEWANPSEEPIVEEEIGNALGLQRDIRFNPSDYRELITNSSFKTVFWTWREVVEDKVVSQELHWYSPDVQSGDFKVLPSAFTVSCFLPSTTAALTGTVAGEVVLFDIAGRAFTGEQQLKERQPIKLLTLHTSSGNSKPILPSEEINQKNESILLENWYFQGAIKSCYMVPGQSYFQTVQAKDNDAQIQTIFYKYLTSASNASNQMTGGATQSFNQAITYMHAKSDGFIVTGGLDGAVRMFDFRLRLLSWYENLESGPITSISIVMPQTSQNSLEQIDMSTAAVQLLPGQTPREFQNKQDAISTKFGSVILRDFLCSTSRGSIILVPAAVFEFIQPEKRRGTILYQGIPGKTTCFYAPQSMTDLPLQQSFNPKTQTSNPLIWLCNDRGDILIYDFTSNKILRSANIAGEILNTGNVKNRLSGTLAQRHAEGFEQASYLLPENPLAPIFCESYPHITSISLFCDLIQKPVLIVGTNYGSALLIDPFSLKVLQQFRNVARTHRIIQHINSKDYLVDDVPYSITHVKFSKEGDIIAIIDESSQLKLLSKTSVIEQKMNYMTGKTDQIITTNNNADNEEFNEVYIDNNVEALRQPPVFIADSQDSENEKKDENIERRTETGVRIHPAAQLARQNQKKRDAASSAGQWDPLGNNLMVCKDQLNSIIFCDFLPFQLFSEIENLPFDKQDRNPLILLSKDRFFTVIDICATIKSGSKIQVYSRFRTDLQATPTAMCYLQRPKFYLDQLKDEDFEQVVKDVEAEPDDLKREVKKALLSLQSENRGYLNATIRPDLQPVDQRDVIIVANNQYKFQIREPKRLPGNYEVSQNTIFTQQQYTANPQLYSHYQGGYATQQPAFTIDKFVTNSSFYVNPRLAGPFPLRRTILGPTFAAPINQLLPIYSDFSDTKNDINSQESVELVNEAGETEKKFKYRTEYEILNSVGSIKHIPQYLVYSTPEKVIGLVRTPLDGSQNKYVGVIAHAGDILQTNVCFCYQQQKQAGNTFTITAGLQDSCLFLWGVDFSQMDILVDSQVQSNDLMEYDPFISQLEGGSIGSYYQEIQEYFSYAQIFDSEAKGMSPSENARAPVSMVSDMMRALGVFISNEHINNAVTEIVEEETRKMRLQSFLMTIKQAVREQKQITIIDTRDGAPAFYVNLPNIFVYFKDYLTKNQTIIIQEDNNDVIEALEQFDMNLWDIVGNNELTLSLQDFIRILVNYRLVESQNYYDIAAAFQALTGSGNTVIDRPGLLNKFYQLGEQFNAGELQDALALITGKQTKNGIVSIQQLLPDQISLNDLACGILKFPLPGTQDEAV